MPATSQAAAQLSQFAAESEPWFRTHLKTLVEHRTISPGGSHAAEIRAGATAAQAIMAAAGANSCLLETAGTPSVLGRFRHPNPTYHVLVYNHLDVQPADPNRWQTPHPFALFVQDDAERGAIYRGRGTTDDKGPALTALRAAAFAATGGLPITISVLWETEEEVGSPHFADAVNQLDERPDAVVVSDTIWPAAGQPAISTGLRGAAQAILRLKTASQEAHSGLVGGVARNPLRELCRLAAAIDTAQFWKQGVVPPDAAEAASFLASGFSSAYFKAAHGLERLETEVPLEMMLALWARPTFEVHGLVGGYAGAGLKATVPDAGELKTSFRLVPEQDPVTVLDSLTDFVQRMNPDVEVVRGGTLSPYRAEPRGPVHEAIDASLTAAFGRRPVLVREGGSIGAVPILAELLRCPVHFLPLSLPEHGYHAPNENFDWRQARGGIEAFARMFAALAGVPVAG